MGLLRKIIITGLLAGIFGLLLVFAFLKVNQPVGTSGPVQIVQAHTGYYLYLFVKCIEALFETFHNGG